MMPGTAVVGSDSIQSRLRALHTAALDVSPVTGATHGFYRYPARFSPVFVEAAIQAFSSPGDLVLDPFMGGATTIVESMRLGRRSVGGDINALSVFVARVKTTPLTEAQLRAARDFADHVIPRLRFTDALQNDCAPGLDSRLNNLHLPHVRPIKKLIALAIDALATLPDAPTRRFIRCALLASGQWALNGRKKGTSCEAFRESVQARIYRMLVELESFASAIVDYPRTRPLLLHAPADELSRSAPLARLGKADLVVTSPPYPGIHMLYHRWQVDGRKESPAPYWITETRDGQGADYYSLGRRKDRTASDYFANLRCALMAIRDSMKEGATIVQMVAFAKPKRDLPRYLDVMTETGFRELRLKSTGSASAARRIWRGVPNRAWHANSKGFTPASREVVLVHTAR